MEGAGDEAVEGESGEEGREAAFFAEEGREEERQGQAAARAAGSSGRLSTASNSDAVEQFLSFTGTDDVEFAREALDAATGDVQVAVERFFGQLEAQPEPQQRQGAAGGDGDEAIARYLAMKGEAVVEKARKELEAATDQPVHDMVLAASLLAKDADDRAAGGDADVATRRSHADAQAERGRKLREEDRIKREQAALNKKLFDAAEYGNAVAVERLAGEGASVDAKGRSPSRAGTERFPAVVIAADNGHTEAVEALLRLRCNPNAPIANGVTALMSAAANGHGGVVGALIKGGADIEAAGTGAGWKEVTALMSAAANGHGGVVDALIKGGATVDSVVRPHGPNGWTALMMAARDGHAAVVGQLLEEGADATRRAPHGDHENKTALEIAEAEGHAEVAALLRS